MSILSSEHRARRAELAHDFDRAPLSMDMVAAEELQAGGLRRQVIELVGAARPDLRSRSENEIADFLDEARERDGFQAVTVREKLGEQGLVAVMWAAAFNTDLDVPTEYRDRFEEKMLHLKSDESTEILYASNAAVAPLHQGHGIGRRALAKVLTSAELSPNGQKIIVYRRYEDNASGERIEQELGVETIANLGRPGQRPSDRYLKAVVTSPEVS